VELMRARAATIGHITFLDRDVSHWLSWWVDSWHIIRNVSWYWLMVGQH
jgi:hypothetical protein